MRRILAVLSVMAVMVMMLAMSVGAAFARTNEHFPIETAYPNSNYNVENVCNVNSGRFQGSSHVAQC
jgi:hypothetical protein